METFHYLLRRLAQYAPLPILLVFKVKNNGEAVVLIIRSVEVSSPPIISSSMKSAVANAGMVVASDFCTDSSDDSTAFMVVSSVAITGSAVATGTISLFTIVVSISSLDSDRTVAVSTGVSVASSSSENVPSISKAGGLAELVTSWGMFTSSDVVPFSGMVTASIASSGPGVITSASDEAAVMMATGALDTQAVDVVASVVVVEGLAVVVVEGVVDRVGLLNFLFMAAIFRLIAEMTASSVVVLLRSALSVVVLSLKSETTLRAVLTAAVAPRLSCGVPTFICVVRSSFCVSASAANSDCFFTEYFV